MDIEEWNDIHDYYPPAIIGEPALKQTTESVTTGLLKPDTNSASESNKSGDETAEYDDY